MAAYSASESRNRPSPALGATAAACGAWCLEAFGWPVRGGDRPGSSLGATLFLAACCEVIRLTIGIVGAALLLIAASALACMCSGQRLASMRNNALNDYLCDVRRAPVYSRRSSPSESPERSPAQPVLAHALLVEEVFGRRRDVSMVRVPRTYTFFSASASLADDDPPDSWRQSTAMVLSRLKGELCERVLEMSELGMP